jgi:SOS response regulatory protein OraA/RecX
VDFKNTVIVMTSNMGSQMIQQMQGDDYQIVKLAVLGEVKAQLQSTEAVRAKALWEKRFGRPPADLAERAKQVRYMMARGFSRSVVSRIIAGADELLEDGDMSD